MLEVMQGDKVVVKAVDAGTRSENSNVAHEAHQPASEERPLYLVHQQGEKDF